MNHEETHEASRQATLLAADSLEKLALRVDKNTEAASNGSKDLIAALGKNLSELQGIREDFKTYMAHTDERILRLERKAAGG